MAEEPAGKSTWLSEISRHLGPIFRHTFPGVLLVGGARLAYPERFWRVDIGSWPNVLVLGVVTVTVGNALFAFNRYGIHQLVDLVFYWTKAKGPGRTAKWWSYTDDLAEFVNASVQKQDTSDIRQYISFRSSSAFLLLTLGEVTLFFCRYHSCLSILRCYERSLLFVGRASIAAYIGQSWVTRRIDDFFVTNKKPNRQAYPKDV